MTLATTAAIAAILAHAGPGSHVTRCEHVSPAAVRCTYRTPSVNAGTEDPSLERTIRTWAVARRRGPSVTVEGPALARYADRSHP